MEVAISFTSLNVRRKLSTYLCGKTDIFESFILTPSTDYISERAKREFVKRRDDKLFSHTDEAGQRDREC